MTNPESMQKEIETDAFGIRSLSAKWAIYRNKVNEAVEKYEEFYTPTINFIRHEIA